MRRKSSTMAHERNTAATGFSLFIVNDDRTNAWMLFASSCWWDKITVQDLLSWNEKFRIEYYTAWLNDNILSCWMLASESFHKEGAPTPERDFSLPRINHSTEIGLSLGTWFGEICSCPCLASRNIFHKTTYQDFSRSLWTFPLLSIAAKKTKRNSPYPYKSEWTPQADGRSNW